MNIKTKFLIGITITLTLLGVGISIYAYHIDKASLGSLVGVISLLVGLIGTLVTLNSKKEKKTEAETFILDCIGGVIKPNKIMIAFVDSILQTEEGVKMMEERGYYKTNNGSLIEKFFQEWENDSLLPVEDNLFQTEETKKKILPKNTKKKYPKNKYDILQNGKGEILIMIDAYEGEPTKPRLIYDNGDTLLLYRSRESAVLLNNIKEKARPFISAAKSVLVVEFDENDDSVREYQVPMHIVEDLDALIKG